MFRRSDEDKNEFTVQPVNKNLVNSGFPAANQQSNPSFQSSNMNQYNDDQQAQQVPFVKTSAGANNEALVKPEAVKDAKPAAAKPAQPTANFVPSALRVPTTSAPSAASQLPSFPPKSSAATGVKIDSIGLETERRLTVGYGISLEGKVSDCDKLVIYGSVNAELNNVKALQISDSGCFRGAAEIDFAEISGVFEGELKVRKSIVINSTGRVSGKITYGSIEIKPGGKFTGEIVEDKFMEEEVSSEEAPEANAAGQDFSLFGDQQKADKAA